MTASRRGSVDAVLLAVFFLVLTGLVVAGFALREWRPPVASAHGGSIDRLITYLLAVTGVIFVVGHAVLSWFILRHRKGDAVYKPVSRRTEWAWALAPVLFMTLVAEVGVLALSTPVWAKMYGPPPEDALVIEVVGKQFEWIVRYPGKDGKFGRTKPALVRDADNPLGLDEEDPDARDDIVFRGSMHLPAGRPVLIRLRSHDVLHSFTIPEFRVKQDVIPGYTGSTQFTPARLGTYEIACVELCGLGHYRMRGFAHVKPPAEFDKWLSEQVGWFE